MNYRRPDGRRYKSTDILRRMCQLCGYRDGLENSMPGGNIVAGAKFLQLVWNMFPKEMQSWLTNDQKIDPFNPSNPLDADEFCDDLQRYWTINFKDEKVAKDKNKDKGENTTQQNSQKQKKSRYNNSGRRDGSNTSQVGRGGPQGRDGNNNGGDQGNRDDQRRCAVSGHENHRHDLAGCHLNPHSRRYDARAAQRFYENDAHAPNVWYRNIYESSGRQSYTFSVGTGRGEGRGGGGRGFGRD